MGHHLLRDRPRHPRPARAGIRAAAMAMAVALSCWGSHDVAADTPIESYIATRNQRSEAVAAAVKTGENQDAVDTRSAAAVQQLERLMTALIGPVTFADTRPPPVFLPTTLVPDYLESRQPDGLLFSSADFVTRFFVAPEPVFADWLARSAKEEDAPEALRGGLAAAVGTQALYQAVMGSDAMFVKYMDLPVTTAPGETVNAALGLFTQTGAQNDVPDSIVFTRMAGGRVVVGAAPVKVAIKPMPACDKIWKGFAAKSKALIAAAEKSKDDQDPRWDQATDVEEEGAAAYQACFAKAAPALPFFAAATQRAQELLAAARGE